MDKIDLRKQFKALYQMSKTALKPIIVDVPTFMYVMIDGTGDPNTSDWFQTATGALYATAYGLKFASKERGRDFTVMALEGLWWADRPEVFVLDRRSEWLWTLMIMQPEWITEDMVAKTIALSVDKKKITVDVAEKVRFESLDEGKAAQILHLGPYSEEHPTIEKLHTFIDAEGFKLRGKHHEIYMSDPRRVAPEKIKTIIRHPVEPDAAAT